MYCEMEVVENESFSNRIKLKHENVERLSNLTLILEEALLIYSNHKSRYLGLDN